MGRGRGELTIGDGKAMASHAVGIPLDDLAGFVIIGCKDGGAIELRHSAADPSVLVNILLNAVQMVVDGLASPPMPE